jgi:fructoselysine 3-epimerase
VEGVKLGIASSVFVNYAIQDAILHVAKAGYDGIDIWGGRPHVYRHDYSQEELRLIRKLLEENNLVAISLMPAFYRYPHSLTSPNEVVRRDSLEYMKICIDNAVQLGADIVLLVPTKSLHGQDPRDAWRRLVESVDALCRYAAQYVLKLGLEVVNHYLTDLVSTAEAARRMMDELHHQNLGVVLDTGHMNLGEETTWEAIRKISGNLLQVHVNDNDGKTQLNLIPGDGTFNFNELIKALGEVGYNGFLSAELGYQYSPDPDPAVRLAAQRMREMLLSG